MTDNIDSLENIQEYLKFVKLSEKEQDDLANFDCLNKNEELEGLKSKQRKKARNHSKDINVFIKEEALQEQKQKLNTTHLLYYKEQVIGFISLCTDSIRLDLEEQQQYEIPYANIPAIKIARLAIHKDYQGLGIGQFVINYAINLVLIIRKYVGIKFITVDCYNHRLSYYQKHLGFTINNNQKPNRQPDNPISLRLHIDKYLENLNLVN